ncbi:hypothetical protein EYR40_007560 [Pleurotus pulmonarius]|nr:hypothetical protein EYR36_008402 [Pleurotus pulmonarius]KAF4579835.1 hypothetical protein EYR36_001655 [Pleurotus pulmonarius]KAF4596751.1 hypothetical protein EYR38_008142 [Pleurotus pulmonarius]KAF4597110.1 hypothetical protein EYR40_007560 [Pleurotus pulmonarius]
MPPALPLNVAPPTPSRPVDGENQKTPSQSKLNSSTSPAIRTSDISSPHELTAFVETLLEQLDAKFDDMSSKILDRMTMMSTRVDALEASIQDIINGDIPQSPSPVLGGTLKRNDTGS